MDLFEVTEGVVNLLFYHLPAVFLILGRCLEPPHIDLMRSVCALTSFEMAPEIAIVADNMVLHVLHGYLQRETNSTDVSDDASVISI